MLINMLTHFAKTMYPEGFRYVRQLNGAKMLFFADCPECGKVQAAVTSSSMENLKTGKGEVTLMHPTDDPKVGDHTWVLGDSFARQRLRSLMF